MAIYGPGHEHDENSSTSFIIHSGYGKTNIETDITLDTDIDLDIDVHSTDSPVIIGTLHHISVITGIIDGEASSATPRTHDTPTGFYHSDGTYKQYTYTVGDAKTRVMQSGDGSVEVTIELADGTKELDKFIIDIDKLSKPIDLGLAASGSGSYSTGDKITWRCVGIDSWFTTSDPDV